VIRWEAPGPYTVAFSTRVGGVSEGPYESLNLGILTGDDPGRVVENRRRLADDVGVDPDRARMAWQRHGREVLKAAPEGILTPGTQHAACDGFWSDEPGQGMMLVTADCLPVAIARSDGDRPALAVLHVGWQGLLAGIVASGVEALGEGRLAAAIGPGIGPCCFEVGEEVLARFEHLGDGIADGRMLDLPEVAARQLAAAGVTDVQHVDRCTSCEPELYFSHRRDGGVTGRQAGIIVRDGS
jgi:YfiH family protein